jgi:hypothetical protein
VDISPANSGSIKFDGEKVTSFPATNTPDYGSTVAIEAVPAPGYHFTKWSGEPTIDQTNPTDVWVIRNIKLTAVFTSDSETTASGSFTSADGTVELFVPEGTTSSDTQGNPVTALEFAIDTDPPTLPNGSIVGQAYRLEPDGATFDPPITLTWSYQASDLPAEIDEEDLYLAYYADDHDEWTTLESDVDTLEDIITAPVTHLTTFAIFAPPLPPTPAPANFELSSLSISPSEVNTEAPVTIRVLLVNTGETAGSYPVTLKINGATEETKRVDLSGGTERKITFTTTQDTAGTYLVDVNGLSGSFTVTEAAVSPPAPPSLEPPPSTESPSDSSSMLDQFGEFVKRCLELVVDLFQSFRNTASAD